MPPALPSPQISDIGHPNPIRRIDCELSIERVGTSDWLTPLRNSLDNNKRVENKNRPKIS